MINNKIHNDFSIISDVKNNIDKEISLNFFINDSKHKQISETIYDLMSRHITK